MNWTIFLHPAAWSAFGFATPALLWGLLLVPLAVAGYVLAQRRRTQYAARFTNLDLLATVVPRTPDWRRHVPPALSLLALAMLLVALARPQAVVPVPKEQATVVLVMDTSGSMMATDVQPSRLSAAASAGETLLGELPGGFRVGIVSFSSGVRTLLAPSTNREAARQALSSLNAGGGTAMGDALAQALQLVQREPAQVSGTGNTTTTVLGAFGAPGATPAPGSRGGLATPTPAPGTANAAGATNGHVPAAVVLLSDGANTTGRADPLEVAQQAQQMGIPIYTIALGTATGSVDVRDQFGRVQHLTVPPDPQTLQRIADLSGGQSFQAPTAAQLQAVYRAIGSQIGFVPERLEVTAAFAGIAALCLITGAALGLLWFNRFP